MTTPLICKGCNKPTTGKYITALGASWHAEHFCCAACGKPIGSGSFYEHQHQPYHDACYRRHVAPRCVYCQQPLVGRYLVDHWGNIFCASHQKEYPACCFCGRMVPPGQPSSRAMSGGKVSCATCCTRAIDRMAQARPIFARLVQWVNSQGLTYHNINLRIELHNRSQLAHFLHNPNDTHALGAALRTVYHEHGSIRTEVNGVAILRGIPSPLFQAVTIHELGHVWLTVHGITTLPQWEEEGICEVLAHRFLVQLHTAESTYYATAIERNPDPIYGAGYRRIHTITEAMGFHKFLESLKRTKQLPHMR